MEREYTVICTTDEVTACDCCGRADLKKTVAMRDSEGRELFFGVVCASRMMGVSAKVVRERARSADEIKELARKVRQDALRRAEQDRWIAFLGTATGSDVSDPVYVDIFRMCETLGGFKAARELYKASLDDDRPAR